MPEVRVRNAAEAVKFDDAISTILLGAVPVFATAMSAKLFVLPVPLTV